MICHSDIERLINNLAKSIYYACRNPVFGIDDLKQHGYIAFLEAQSSWSGKIGNFNAYAHTCIRRAMIKLAKPSRNKPLEDGVSIDCGLMVNDILSMDSLTTKEIRFIKCKLSGKNINMSRSSEWRIKKSLITKLRQGGYVNA